MKKTCLLPVVLLIVIFSNCHNNSEIKTGYRLTSDMLGREIKVPEKVQKIVGVKAGALRLISYLNAADMVSGVEDSERNNRNPYNFAFPVYRNLPIIGPMHGGDAELIAMAKPDVIFMTYATVDEADKLQNKTGIPVVALHYGDFSKNRDIFYTAVKLMADIIGKSQRADSLIHFIQESIKDLDQRTKDIPLNERPLIYAGGVSFKGSHGISSTSPDFAPFELIHANCPASQYESSSNNIFIDKEKLIEWNPEKIFIDYAGWQIVKEELEQEALSQTLSAVKDNELYPLFPYNWYTTNFATVLVNAYYAGTITYPEAFSGVELETKADEIYKAFLNKPAYHKMIESFGELKKINLYMK